jgi:CBS domain-containing protein
MKAKMRRRHRTRRPPSRDQTSLTARDIMNPKVVTVRDDLTVQELATFLTENEISGAPVLNEKGKLVGVVSVTDIAECAGEGAGTVWDGPNPHFHLPGSEGRLTPGDLRQMHIENEGPLVRQIMTPTVYTIPEGTAVAQIAKTMISGRIHRLLVTRRARVVGIITTLDMLKLLVARRK